MSELVGVRYDSGPGLKRRVELWAMPSISSQMPIAFANGNGYTELQGECRRCGRTLADDQMRGALTRLTEHVVLLEAVGVCEPCKCCTSFLYRCYDDLRITGPRDGTWLTWKLRPTLLQEMGYRLRRLGRHVGLVK